MATYGTSTASSDVWYYKTGTTTRVKTYKVEPPKRKPERKEEPMEFQVGSKVKIIKSPSDHHLDLTGQLGTIVARSLPLVTVEFLNPIEMGHDGGREVCGKVGHCWNVDVVCLTPLSDSINIVSKDFKIQGRNVKGEKVKILKTFSTSDQYLVLVEFGEDIGGHSGDGLGKKGHCWTLPSKIVETQAIKKKGAK
jgi:hypothetical protein